MANVARQRVIRSDR